VISSPAIGRQATSPPHPTGVATLPNAIPPGSRWCGNEYGPSPMPPSTSWACACTPPPRSPPVAPPGVGFCASSTGLAKNTFHAVAQERPDLQHPRVDFRHILPQVAPEAWRFLDEAGSPPALARDEARAPRGQRAHATKPVNRGRHSTRLGALGRQGMGAAMTVEGCTEGDGFGPFLHEVLVPQLRPGPVIIMAHLPAHTVAGVAEAIALPGARLRYLPPYAPDLSPIEACWSKVKTLLRAQAARTLENLEPAIAAAIAAITATDARGWFTHAGYCASFN
jgi:transposase